jgi:hypothetical protein
MSSLSLNSEGKQCLFHDLQNHRQFPITLTGNQNVKIGVFNLTLVSSFPVAHYGLGSQPCKYSMLMVPFEPRPLPEQTLLFINQL